MAAGDQDTWTLDDSARASNPGGLRVQPLRWISHYPKWPMIWFFGLTGFILLGVFWHWGCFLAAALFFLLNWLYWRRIFEHFRFGCTNPAVIVSLQPMLIAAATDLTTGSGSFPAVKILKKQLSSVGGQTPAVEMQLPTIALYTRSPDADSKHWSNFDPRPVECATNDLSEQLRILRSIPNEEWAQLYSWIRKVPRPFSPGLYLISPEP